MDKKGDVTVTILVIGIIVVCFLALISFYLAKLNTDENFDIIGKIVQITVRMEKGDRSIDGSDAYGGPYLEEKKIVEPWFFGDSKEVFSVRYYFPKES